ncbi:MAG: hypothetical protein P3W96_003805, partial [Halomonas sp.]
LVLVLCLGERDLLHRTALSDGGGMIRFYPAGVDPAATAGFVQCFLKVYDGKSLFYNANVLHVLLFRIKSQASSLGSKPFEEECLTIQKSALDVISRLKELREELIACLKL